MSTQNLNHVVITGNLTSDPELRSLPSGTSVCKLRVAVNARRKDGASGEWVDKANYFDVTVWGAQGENAARYLSKGRPVGVQGRLDWREWETSEGGKRQAVEIIADQVQFLGTAPSNGDEVEVDPAGDAEPEPAATSNGTAKRSSRRKREPEPVGVGATAGDERLTTITDSTDVAF
jgi:single-strand DNA-binding protein